MLISPRPRWRLMAVALTLSVAPVTAGHAIAPTDSYVGGLGWVGFSKADLDSMNAAAARLYEGSVVGTTERWSSPDSGRAGAVMLIASFDFRGMPCRTLTYTIMSAGQGGYPGHYLMNWCQVSDGAWKIVEVPASH
jgi:surface antigen